MTARLGFFARVLFAMLLGAASPAAAAPRERSAPELAPLWQRLDTARCYRATFQTNPDRRRNTTGCAPGGSYTQMISAYKTPSFDLGGRTPKCVFRELAGLPSRQPDCPSSGGASFAAYLDSPTFGDEALWGLQETLNEIIAGQLLVGNDELLTGLRTRFPRTGDPADPDHLTLLRRSDGTLSDGVDDVVDALRNRPESLRASGTVNPTFPFFVENAPKPPAATGEVVESELYRFTDLVKRRALAGNSVGKRLFYFSNDSPDLNLEQARQEAAGAFKRSAQATYLHTALLAALQTEDEFNDNNGYELKREIADAQRGFEDIQAGFNPLKLRGDFVPHQRFENLLDDFQDKLELASNDEANAQQFARTYDTDQTALQTELQGQRERYLDTIASLTGLSATQLSAYDLTDAEARDQLFTDADSAAPTSTGVLGQRYRAIEAAAIDAKLAHEELRQIPERIRIEEERQDSVALVTLATGASVAALDVSIGIAGAVPKICACGVSSGAQTDVGQVLQGIFRGTQTLLRALESSTIGNINSAATIKNYLLQQATQLIAVERAGFEIEARKAEYRESQAELERAVRNYVSAQDNLATAYFTNPAYRLQLDLARENADQSFEAAMVAGYFAAMALEYEWSERFENPVRRLDGALPEPIGDAVLFNPIVRAESVFASRSVANTDAPAPRLAVFAQALRSWDVKMRQLRNVSAQSGRTRVVSLRKDILGLTGGDETYNRLAFSDWIAKRRVAGNNPAVEDLVVEFALQVADQFLFPALPNLKIEQLRVNLWSLPGRSLLGPQHNGSPALVDFVMLDNATIRTFFAQYPNDDDLLTIDLEAGRSLSQSPFYALVESTINGLGSVAPNTEHENRSPAVSRWTLRIDSSSGQNGNLQLQYLDDIEITFTYKTGKPRDFSF
jgi:hypothetical protein